MRVLLDTHVAVWAVMGDARLSGWANELIEAPSTQPFVSPVSLWEIAIKHRLQRRRDPMPFGAAEAQSWFHRSGFRSLPVEDHHALTLDDLPPLHGDPFDRLLVAQAMSEPMRLLTRDERLAAYTELVIVA